MARLKIFNEMDEALGFFPSLSHAQVERIIERVMRDQLSANRRATKAKLVDRGSQRLAQAARGFVAKQLTASLSLRGAAPRQALSVKERAPDTGGRPFHFAHSYVSRVTPTGAGEGSVPSSKAPGIEVGADATTSNSASSGTGGKVAVRPRPGRSAAHMRYIERAGAVERGSEAPEVGREAGASGRQVDAQVPAKEQAFGEPRKGTSVAAEVEGERSPGEGHAVGGSSAGAGQSYVEAPRKLENGEKVLFSFGTIGATFEERVRFWEKLEANERNRNGRVQDRLIVELPHEATGEQRHEMMQIFAREFEKRGLPFWVAMHAPGDRNDARNFHAHIVYSTRPAKRMEDPSDGIVKWDFEIIESYKTSSRHTRSRHPYRQTRCSEMERGDAIPKLRRAFAEAVNTVLVRDGVEDAAGEAVRYDARSYRDMGVDVVPMRTINRIVSDKMREGKLTVLDRGYTRKMIEAELRDARARRDRELLELDRTRRAIEAWARAPGSRQAARALPAMLRPKRWAGPSQSVIRNVGRALLEARHAAYVQDVVDRSARATLDRIVEATSPEALAKPRARRKASEASATSPDPEVAAALHAEALHARHLFEAETALNAKRLKLRVGRALNSWSAATSVQVVETPLSEAARLARERKPHRPAHAAQARAGSSVLDVPHNAQGDEVRAHELGGSTSRNPARETREDSSATAHRARESAVTGVTPFRHHGSPEDEGAPLFEGHAPSVVTTMSPEVTVARTPDAAESRSQAGNQQGRLQVPEVPNDADIGPSADAEAGTAAVLQHRLIDPISTGATAVSGKPDDPESISAPQGPGTKASNKSATVQTRWGAIRADDAASIVACVKLQLDGVIAGLRSIKDFDARFQAIEDLGRSDSAMSSVMATIPRDDAMVLRAALRVRDELGHTDAKDLVEDIMRYRRNQAEEDAGAPAGTVEPMLKSAEKARSVEEAAPSTQKTGAVVQGAATPPRDQAQGWTVAVGVETVDDAAMTVGAEPSALPVLRRDVATSEQDNAQRPSAVSATDDGPTGEGRASRPAGLGQSSPESGAVDPVEVKPSGRNDGTSGAQKLVDAERRRLVGRYATVLIGRKAWTTERGDRLAAVAHIPRHDLWRLALDECQTRYGHRSPKKIEAENLTALRSEVKSQATGAGFSELLFLMHSFSRTAGRKDKGLGR